MEAIQCIKGRRSVRKFTNELVSEAVMKQIIEAASYAPSWKNTQIARYNLIQKEELIQRIAKDATLQFQGNIKTLETTKNLVVISYVKGRSGFERDGSYTTSKGEQWQMFDAGIATQTFCLAAHSYGIGTVIMGIFDENEVAKIINLPETEAVAAILAIGYQDEEPVQPKRKDVDELLRIQQ